jgi:hypothetical protein
MCTNSEKSFDCLEFKQQAQTQIYQEIKHLSTLEKIQYFRNAAASGTTGEWRQSLQKTQFPNSKLKTQN